jgi:hypothetical protein
MELNPILNLDQNFKNFCFKISKIESIIKPKTKQKFSKTQLRNETYVRFDL